MKKKYRILMLAGCLSLMWGITSAAEEEVKIDKVSVQITCNPVPEAGEDVGTVSASTSGTEFTVEGAEYENDAGSWILGDEPVVLVELEARPGYRFSYTSKSHFELSGNGGASFKRARIYDSGATMELQVELDQITGRLGPVEDMDWDGRYAWWEHLDGAKSYEVRLYRNDTTVGTYTTDDNEFDFTGKYTRAGDYTFRVRGIADYNSRAGEWSDYSEEYYISAREAGWKNPEEPQRPGDPGKKEPEKDRWEQNPSGWRYRFGNGSYMSGGWLQLSGTWYYFGNDSYMKTGWQHVNGKWYYMSGNGGMLTGWQYINGRWYYLEGSGAMLTGWQYINGRWYYLEGSGAMLTGWQYINGKWYYLEGSGAMLTGWQYINGNWYYLGSSGAMYADAWTPDGFYMGRNGAYTGQRR